MPDIATIKFGKNLRPTTVESVNKINELIAAVNKLDPDAITSLNTEVSNLKNTVGSHTTQIQTASSDISNLKTTTDKHTTDIDKIKVTLYTPLATDESRE